MRIPTERFQFSPCNWHIPKQQMNFLLLNPMNPLLFFAVLVFYNLLARTPPVSHKALPSWLPWHLTLLDILLHFFSSSKKNSVPMKTTRKYWYTHTHIKMDKVKKMNTVKCWWGCGTAIVLRHHRVECKTVRLLEQLSGSCLKLQHTWHLATPLVSI